MKSTDRRERRKRTAIAWKVAQSPKVDKIYCAPGNAGIEEYAECVNIGAMEFDKLDGFCKRKRD